MQSAIKKNMIVWGTFLFILSVAFLFHSNPFADFLSTDSAVFFYIGKMMHYGAIPYRDFFDHKGPLLYFINYLGCAADIGIQGIWVIELLLLFISLAQLKNFIGRYFNKQIEIFAVLFYTFCFFWHAHNGNLCETYGVFFITSAMLLLYENILSCTFPSKKQGVYISFCFVALLMLRPNMCSFAVPAGIWMIYNTYLTKKVKDFWKLLGVMLFSVLIMIAVPLVWLYANNALYPFVDSYWTFNLMYMKNGFKINLLIVPWVIFSIITLIETIYLRGPFQRLSVFNFIFLLTSGSICVLYLQQWHYMLPLIIGYVIAAVTLQKFDTIARFHLFFPFFSGIMLPFFLLWIIQTNFEVGDYIRDVKRKKRFLNIMKYREGYKYSTLKFFQKYIKKNNSVLVLGNECIIYQKLNLSTSFRYMYQVPIANISPKIRRKCLEYIEKKNSQYIVANKNQIPDFLKDVLIENYAIITTFDEWVLFERNLEPSQK